MVEKLIFITRSCTRLCEEIANPGKRKLLTDIRAYFLMGHREIEEFSHFFTDFDQHCQALLSSALLHFYLMHNRHLAAAKCCEHGACFTENQFAQMKDHVPEEDRTSWLTTLLKINALNNRLDIVQLLLRSGACMEAATGALREAAFHGHEPVTKLLLDHRADMSAASNTGHTALMGAAVGGHEAVAKLLLDHRADVAAAGNDGHTALILAAAAGHKPVTKLLLDHRADVAAADNHGVTALFVAAAGGHEAMAKLLLDHRADMAAADNDGATALIVTAAGGHEVVAKLLLDHRADVAAANNHGATALVLAAEAGHKPVTKLLLDHRADVAAAGNDGHTALILAAAAGHEAATKLDPGVAALIRAAMCRGMNLRGSGKAAVGPSRRRGSCSKQWCHCTDPCC